MNTSPVIYQFPVPARVFNKVQAPSKCKSVPYYMLFVYIAISVTFQCTNGSFQGHPNGSFWAHHIL